MNVEITKKKVNGNKYEFVSEYWETRNSWGHECTLYKNGTQVAHSRARYYNRTWEQYRFQTVMQNCVSDLKEQAIKAITDAFKTENGYKVITAKRQPELDKYIKKNKEYKEYCKLYDSLKLSY